MSSPSPWARWSGAIRPREERGPSGQSVGSNPHRPPDALGRGPPAPVPLTWSSGRGQESDPAGRGPAGQEGACRPPFGVGLARGGASGTCRRALLEPTSLHTALRRRPARPPTRPGPAGSESRGRRGPARARPWVLPSVARPPWAVRTPLPTRLRLRPGQPTVLLTRGPVAFSWRRRRVLGAFSPRAESGSASAGRHTPRGPCPPRTLAFLSVTRAFWLSLVGFLKEMQVSTVVTLIAQDEWTHLA